MSGVCLRVEPVGLCGLDDQVWALGPVRFVRDDAGISLESDDEGIASSAMRALARAGARAIAAQQGPREHPPHGAIAAVAPHLERIDVPGILDTVSVRPLAPGEAAARLVHRGVLGRGRADVDAIRAVLRESERVFLWRRIVWMQPRLARSGELGRLRPIVFDRAALERPEDRLGFTSADALTRWAR